MPYQRTLPVEQPLQTACRPRYGRRIDDLQRCMLAPAMVDSGGKFPQKFLPFSFLILPKGV